ncbi:MAG: UDP-2,3-diacylglucosamine diphosphatase LpxI [Phycisphaerae bacterium]|nr:UDP-2,3-diacylglucosamine diphosphatase LpxI [Phycisphaerae bacterium]
MDSIGLIAGEGIFPFLVARGARAAGKRVVCLGLSGSVDDALAAEVDWYRRVSVVRISSWIRALRRQRVEEAVMVGRVVKTRMYARFGFLQNIPDLRTARLWFTRLRHDKRPFAILSALADTLEAEGIRLIDSTTFTRDQLVTAGVLTRTRPTEAQMMDARHGWELCRQISRLDIGQSIAIKAKDVIAVEALEGTNAMIERAGSLCPTGGWTLIKVANARQDMRMDVPTVGVKTIEKLAAAGARCVVLEAGKTTFLEKDKVIELADRCGIAIVGMESP